MESYCASLMLFSFLPITPQHAMVERIYRFHAQGLLDAEMVEAEGEQSAMSIVTAATACGVRAFTATSQAGLFFMWDAFRCPPALRLPVVMANVNRAIGPGWNIWAEHTDSLQERDTGWLQAYVSTVQETYDTILMAYRIAEHNDVRAGRSPSAGPGQFLRYAAQARFGKMSAFFPGSADMMYFSGWTFPAEGDNRARSTSSFNVSRSTVAS
jgi:hypothetical protein